MLLTKRLHFCAAHRLHNPEFTDEENKRIFGICNNANGHGHNYELEVTVKGEVPLETGMIIDLKELKDITTRVIIQELDHKHLNHDVTWLEGVNPTAENIAMRIWDRLEQALPPMLLHEIKLFETPDSYVTYQGR